MELKSSCRKSEQVGPAIFSISFEMLSKPVALPMARDIRPSFISVVVMGVSLSRGFVQVLVGFPGSIGNMRIVDLCGRCCHCIGF